MKMIYDLNWCAWTVDILALVIVLLGITAIVLTGKDRYELSFKIIITILVLGVVALFLRYSPWYIAIPL
jgi:hypothetical protein